MANEIKNAKAGLRDLLQAIPSLKRVYTYDPESPGEFPIAVIRFVGSQPLTIGGSSFAGEATVTVVMGARISEEATDQLDEFMMPVGENSVEAAVDADNTWGGNVDDGRLTGIVNVGYRSFPFDPVQPRYAADFNFRFLKQVTT